MDIVDLTSSADNDDLIVIESHQIVNFKQLKKLDFKQVGGIKFTQLNNLDEGTCTCTTADCDQTCLNRMLKIECFTKHTNKQNTNCAHVMNCDNRCFSTKLIHNLKVYNDGNKGFGIKIQVHVPANSFIIEYVGEVICTDQMNQQMVIQRREKPDDHNFYIMSFEKGFYIDGKLKGNESRFINHSCDPNCKVERWNVQGRTRIGIFAIKDLLAGDFLSYDYRLETPEESIFGCECGSINCRGTLAISHIVLNKKRKI